MAFQFPEAFLLLLLVVPVLFVLRGANRRAERAVGLFETRPRSRWRYYSRIALVTLFVGSLAAIGARPYNVLEETGDYLFLVDISRSMQARASCNEPTFLDRSKSVMRQVISGVPEGRFGIIVFERLAFPVTQMTYDHAYLEEVIDRALFTGLIYDRTATRAGNALSIVAEKKERLPEAYGNVKHVILLTDGHVDGEYRDLYEEPLAQLNEAKIRLFPVGIGNPVETPIPVEADGECVERFVVKNGQLVTVPLRADILRFIAERTEGTYFGEGEVDDLVRFLREETLEKTAVESGTGERQRDELDWLFLFPATLALFGMLLLDSNMRFR